MLYIPEEVKEILKKDSVKKNLRISFPNGERADITNENIISESMSFTESICSRDYLKFGLCEAPVIEFETVGIENIKGMEIEASLEVDVTSAENVTKTVKFIDGQASFVVKAENGIIIDDTSVNVSAYLVENPETKVLTITMGNVDNNTQEIKFLSNIGEMLEIVLSSSTLEKVNVHYSVGDKRDDLPYTYYSIPLGRFVVSECPRNKTLFEKRNVRAYGFAFEDLHELSPIEKAKRNVACASNTPYRMDAEKYVYSCLTNDYIIPGAKYNNVTGFSSFVSGYSFGSDYYFNTEGKKFAFTTEAAEQNLYYVTYNSTYTLQSLREEMEAWLGENLPSYKVEIMEGFEMYADSLLFPEMFYLGAKNYHTSGNMVGHRYLYPYSSSGLNYSTYERSLFIPTKLEIMKNDGTVMKTFTLRKDSDVAMQYVVLENEPIWLEIPRQKSENVYTVAEQIHYPIDVAQALLELRGLFGRYARNGSFETVSLKDRFGLFPSEKLFPSETLYPKEANGGMFTGANYTSLWYDDENTKPYGKIVALYINENGEESVLKHDIPADVSPKNETLVQEVSVESNDVYFQWLGQSVNISDAEEIRIECPYAIKSAYVTFETSAGTQYSFDIELDEGATSFVLNENTFDSSLEEFKEIGIILENQTEYSGSAYLYKYNREYTYYNESDCITYYLTDNYILQNSKISETILTKFIKEMASNIKDVFYLPSEIEMQGLPYLESGDVIQIEGQIQTIILRRTINGIQSLKDNIESKG